MKGFAMRKTFRRTRELRVTFCDRCGSVCTPACRQESLLRQARDRAFDARGGLL
jgi:hypothetical protein